MALDAYILIEGVEGESTDAQHKGWIEMQSFGNGHRQPVSRPASTAGGGASGRADFYDFYFEKLLDKASPKITLLCASGRHIDKISVAIYRAAGDDRVKYMEYTMTNCIISDYLVSGDCEDNFPLETVGINYGRIVWNYIQQRRDGGGPAGNIMEGWDLQTNSKV